MSESDRPAPQGYQASSLVVSPRPNEFGFAMREDEFQILCDAELGNARSSRDLCIGSLVGAVVGLIGVLATTDWGTIWQPEKRGTFLFWLALLFLIVASSTTGAIIFHLRLRKTRTDSAYARLINKISAWFTSQQGAANQQASNELVIISAKYGAYANWVDISSVLSAKIQDGKLRIDVTNASLLGGDDPVPNVPKSADVKYSYGGRRPQSIIVPEGEVLSLPEP
ncbi:MAG TPA: DUF3395 domain-containing protein [Nitrososphaera sp.]|nr:DUF3395 domain-containing protein [Nitrososphaera sp.]